MGKIREGGRTEFGGGGQESKWKESGLSGKILEGERTEL